MADLAVDQVIVQISGLSAEGSGIGTIVDGTPEIIGKKCIVPFTIPGEQVVAARNAAQSSKTLEVGTLVQILGEPALTRQKPPCPHFGVCGGCSLQHMSLKAQRESKVAMVTSLLERHAQMQPRDGYQLLGEELPGFEYRNRIHLHLSTAGELGFYRTGTGEAVDVERCLLAEPPLQNLLSWIRQYRLTLAARVAAIKLELRSGYPPAVLLKPRVRGGELDKEIRLLERSDLKVLHDEQRESDVGHFSQVNTGANEILVKTVIKKLTELRGNQKEPQDSRVTEFYAGAGNFTFALVESGFLVDAVEVDAQLTAAAEKIAEKLPAHSRPRYFTMSCERFLKGKHPTNHLVLLDPPRAGAKAVSESLSPRQTNGIVYVSCNPATLARDLKTLRGRGFELEKLYILDMFSQTAHVESIAILHASKS